MSEGGGNPCTVRSKLNKFEHVRGFPVWWGGDWGQGPVWIETDILTDITENITLDGGKNPQKQEEDVKCQEAVAADVHRAETVSVMKRNVLIKTDPVSRRSINRSRYVTQAEILPKRGTE